MMTCAHARRRQLQPTQRAACAAAGCVPDGRASTMTRPATPLCAPAVVLGKHGRLVAMRSGRDDGRHRCVQLTEEASLRRCALVPLRNAVDGGQTEGLRCLVYDRRALCVPGSEISRVLGRPAAASSSSSLTLSLVLAARCRLGRGGSGRLALLRPSSRASASAPPSPSPRRCSAASCRQHGTSISNAGTARTCRARCGCDTRGRSWRRCGRRPLG